ncbi:trypsin-like peptidase domain-containing protein [Arcticibacter eurypsychrophilus]|uniref:trypsin-like peptidase domain-containing protein n=1 Tax=Arcticibacter eurypsychrophilus TaxID=1434752 RepID=UPI00084DC9AB|nr:trypsin-like peptidase domain-containing protein [Arcticibacter eurypsychrophilus]
MRKIQLIMFSVILFSVQILGINCTNNTGQDGLTSQDSLNGKSLKGKIGSSNSTDEYVNFVSASKAVTPAVVHIKTLSNVSSAGRGNNYGSSGRSVPAMGSASGVIITADGYIATNNHVVENASSIEVILPDKRKFIAKLIGRDPNTDLALIKVDATGLPTVKFGNSDIAEVGEWVIAVGYPFSLNTTVTAGIISAKARSIGIINQPENNTNQVQIGNTAVESFIQTDAAINPGNSGGALVNTSGELIGINSAIASQTGSYEGYAFAIPVNLAKKILDDLKKYGSVKRGVLGVSFPSPALEDQYFAQQGLSGGSVKGVYITGVFSESAAASAGLKEGDIIRSIDGLQLTSSSQFSEMIARHKPGDVIKLSYMRKGKVATASVTLKSEEPAKKATTSSDALKKIYNRLGASFAPLTAEIKQHFNLNSGVVVTDVTIGGFFDQIGIPKGTIIAFINGKPIDNPKDIDSALLSAQRGTIQILAIAPDGSKVVFNFSLGT